MQSLHVNVYFQPISAIAARQRLLSANECNRWAFERRLPKQSIVSLVSPDGQLLEVTCEAFFGTAFTGVDSNGELLRTLAYRCDESSPTEYTLRTPTFDANEIPHCTGERKI